jgi:hypothetical protein
MLLLNWVNDGKHDWHFLMEMFSPLLRFYLILHINQFLSCCIVCSHHLLQNIPVRGTIPT